MIELGKFQRLEVLRKTQNGVYLNSKKNKNGEDVLLPKNQVPAGTEIGDEIEVFVYKDSEDRIIATTKKPAITLGELAVLKVIDITKVGAFLDWGLEKDLFLPFKEQVGDIKNGSNLLVTLYVDKSDRLCATMDIYELLSVNAPFKEKDRTVGTIYRITADYGAFVAVENKYHGLIPKKELYGSYEVGDTVEVRIKKVREDGKLELSLRQEAYNEIEGDAQKIMKKLESAKGKLNLNDKSSPELIKTELNISKAAFKRAVGRLLKEGAIKITDNGIEKMW